MAATGSVQKPRVRLLLDATCDIPAALVKESQSRIAPIQVLHGEDWRLAAREPGLIQTLLSLPDEARPCRMPDSAVLKALFEDDLIFKADRVLGMTQGSGFAPMHQQLSDSYFGILNEYRAIRQDRGVGGSFSARIIDTRSLAAGQGLLAWHALELIRIDTPFKDLRGILDKLATRVRCWIVTEQPRTLFSPWVEGGPPLVQGGGARIASWRGKCPLVKLHDNASEVPMWERDYPAAIEAVIGRAIAAINSGLNMPFVAVSFAGDPTELKENKAFKRLRARAREQDVELMLSMMSAPLGVALGNGALSIAWAADEH